MRLTALAQLVALYATQGVTSTKQLADTTGFTERAIWKAKAELRFTERKFRGGLNNSSVKKCGSSPLKKKGLPHTPSKEKTNPPPPRLVDRSQPITTVEPAANARAKFSEEESQPIIKWLARSFKQTEEQAGKFLTGQVETIGRKTTQRAYRELRARVDAGEKFHQPSRIWALIVRDLQENQKPIPWGALELGDGQYVSLW